METLLTVEQYAAQVKLHPDSVRRQLRQGRLPRAIKKGRVWRIPSSVVHEDSRLVGRASTWAEAAALMAEVYADALQGAGALTAITSAPGEFHQQAGADEAGAPEDRRAR